jgi:hypothetical protein
MKMILGPRDKTSDVSPVTLSCINAMCFKSSVNRIRGNQKSKTADSHMAWIRI